MERYFNEAQAVSAFSNGNIENTLELVASRYIKANPESEYIARPFLTGVNFTAANLQDNNSQKPPIIRNRNYRYDADFTQIFPDTPNGSYVYCWGKYLAKEDAELKFTLIPKGPAKIYMNEEEIYGTDVVAERYANNPVNIMLPVKKGWNHLVLRFTRTKAGFGAEFGTWLGKLDYFFFRGKELPEFPGLPIEGFDYTVPLDQKLICLSPENLEAICLPLSAWTGAELKRGIFGRVFGETNKGERVVARTVISVSSPVTCYFKGTHNGNCGFYVNEKLIGSFKEEGAFQFEYELEEGRNSITVISECPGIGRNWDFAVEVEAVSLAAPGISSDTISRNASRAAYSIINLQNPFFCNSALPWVFAGPFKKTSSQALTGPIDRELLVGSEGEKTFWRLDMSGAWVRLYNENPLYGHWNYPLGVTLYGLIETSRFFEQSDQDRGSAIDSYVRSHVAKSIRTLDYALFDKERFGGATSVHHLLTSIDSLDDCGSFASLVLEIAKDGKLPKEFSVTADYAGDHILNKQDRLPEGCFYRHRLMHHFHNDTLWADDLYMSVPFLCRYAAYKNDPSILDTAAVQFEGFKKYLFMEDKGLMAHVYDLKRNMNNGIPWGRGNGWTIFSLSELLMVLPEDHPRRDFLISFFREHAAGCLACQDESGMWHQVLDMPSSYIETSCTAMFISAFCRGIRYNWFNGGTSPYRIAAGKAWRALENYSIDRKGNIYGVCRGSEFAFNPRYYAEHLLPRLNDTHGIGIVLLAGVELLKLRRQIQGKTGESQSKRN